MHKLIRLLLWLLASTMLLGTVVAIASGRNLRINERTVEMVWDEAIPGKTPFEFRPEGAMPVKCRLTLSIGFIESTIAKTAGRIGNVNNATVESCSSGSETVLRETLPWHVNYVGFSGSLPRITAVRLSMSGMAFQATTPEGVQCLWGPTPLKPGFVELGSFEERGAVESVRVDETVTIPLGGGFVCGLSGNYTIGGTALLRNLAGTVKISVTLI